MYCDVNRWRCLEIEINQNKGRRKNKVKIIKYMNSDEFLGTKDSFETSKMSDNQRIVF